MTFDTEKQAWNYILKCVNECDYCGKWWWTRKQKLWYSPCGAEWNVLKTDDFMKAETFDEYLEACGYVSVYKKGDKENQSLDDILG